MKFLKNTTLILTSLFMLSACVNIPFLHKKGSPERNSSDYVYGLKYERKKQLIKAIELLKPLAESGHTGAQYALGRIYEKGYGKNVRFRISKKFKRMYRNPTIAAKWYMLAAEKGVAGAMDALGRLFEKGEGVIKYLPASYMWYSIAASKGNKNSARSRDNITRYLTTKQITKSESDARACVANQFKNCTPLNEFTVIPAEQYQARLDHDYFAKKSVYASYARMTISDLHLVADKGDSIAQFLLGWQYQEGKKTLKDSARAIKWFKKSAKGNNAQAQYFLGNMYRHGFGVDTNVQQAAKYFQMAASQGIGKAMHALGDLIYYKKLKLNSGAEKTSRKVNAYIWHSIAVAQVHYFASSYSSTKSDNLFAGNFELFNQGRSYLKNVFNNFSRSQKAQAQELTHQCIKQRLINCI